MARFCTACGTQLADETARFCAKCGAGVPSSPISSATAASLGVSRPTEISRSYKTLPASAPKPAVAGILAGLFPFGVGAVYVGQYRKGWMYTIISLGLTFGMSRRSPISTVCGVVYVFYYVWQIIDAVRATTAMRSAGGITNLSTMKRATIAAGMVLAIVTLAITRVAIEDRLGETKSVEAATTANEQQAASGTSVAAAQEQSQPDTDACVEGAKDCEGKAAGIWLVETHERRGTSYSCPDPQAEALIKVSLVHGSSSDDGSRLDVANVNAFHYGSEVNLWGASVYNPPKYGERPDGSYHLRGERQFADQDADVTLELHPLANRMKYFISAQRSGSDDILFLAQGTCTKVADKSGFWAINPDELLKKLPSQ